MPPSFPASVAAVCRRGCGCATVPARFDKHHCHCGCGCDLNCACTQEASCGCSCGSTPA